MCLVLLRSLLAPLSAILLLLPSARAVAQDGDSDGIVDGQDNCVVVVNPTQLDTNRDGFGNRCDTDYNNDGNCGLSDFGVFKIAFGSSVGGPSYNADVDAEGDGAIGLSDFGVFKQYFVRAPGPSGLDCAGTIPCACATPVLNGPAEPPSVDVGLTWTADAGFEFVIDRRAEGAVWTTLASVGVSESSYVDASPVPDFYEYRMRANCSAVSESPQWSEYSNVVAVELPQVCP